MKLVPASDHIATQSQRAALAGLSRRCAWWSGQALEARPEASFTDLISARHVDYSGDVSDRSHVLLNRDSWPRPLLTASMNVTAHEWERVVEVLF